MFVRGLVIIFHIPSINSNLLLLFKLNSIKRVREVKTPAELFEKQLNYVRISAMTSPPGG